MKVLSSLQKTLFRIASIILIFVSIYNLNDEIRYVVDMFGYLFDYDFMGNVSNLLWLLSNPIYFLLALATAVLSFSRNSQLLIKCAALLVGAKLLFTFLLLAISLIRNGTEWSWTIQYLINWIIGWDSLASHFTMVIGNLSYLAIGIAVALNFLSKRGATANQIIPTTDSADFYLPPRIPVSENPTGDLAELARLFEAGHLSDAEFKAAKKRLLG